MAKYTIIASSFVTIMVSKTYEIEADSAKEAEIWAEAKLDDYIRDTYPWADYDEVRTDIVAKEED